MNSERIMKMEIKLSELEQTVSELNDVVTKQWVLIDKHSIENKHLQQKLKGIEAGLKTMDDVPPPHY